MAPSRRKQIVRLLALAALAAAIVFVLRYLPTGEAIAWCEDWLEALGWWGPLAFFVAYIVLALVFFPTWILTVAAGAVFGLLGGSALSSVSATAAAAASFLVARHLVRDRVRARIARSRKLAAIDRAVGREGWKIVALLRLSPAAPFTVQNYLYGISAIRFWTCIGVSWLTMIPGTFLYVYLGTLGRDALRTGGEAPSALEWGVRIVGLAATIVLTLYTARIAQRAVRDAELEMQSLAEEEPTPSG